MGGRMWKEVQRDRQTDSVITEAMFVWEMRLKGSYIFKDYSKWSFKGIKCYGSLVHFLLLLVEDFQYKK